MNLWPFRKPPEQINPGRELAKMRNPDKRRSYKAFHDTLAKQVGAPPIEWAD